MTGTTSTSKSSTMTLVAITFSFACGILLDVLGCALPEYDCWWPMFIVIFYVLAPIPIMIANRLQGDFGTESGVGKDIAIYCTAVFVTSGFAFPMLLAHTKIIQPGAMGLILGGSVIVYLTILAYSKIFNKSDDLW
ncbi:Leptin receptor gene-related protein [Trichoplax sp. H2]|nr:Leptin receptor gene-related protein [Trichoplax sp. H2]|eukprot:RDD43207.1 Leptin receptor gene-related protein [Trichoplax sp. H2]